MNLITVHIYWYTCETYSYLSASLYTELSQITAPDSSAQPPISEAAYVNIGMYTI